jgi:hypothetical protein
LNETSDLNELTRWNYFSHSKKGGKEEWRKQYRFIKINKCTNWTVSFHKKRV